MSSQVRELQIADADLRSCDVSRVVKSFNRAEREQISRLPELRSSFLIMFPSLDADDRHNYLIPEVRCFIRKLYDAIPHFFYYLHPEPALGAVGMHTLCLLELADLDVQENRAMPKSNARLADAMAKRLKPAADFAKQIGDNAESLVMAFRRCVPDDEWARVRKHALGQDGKR